MGGSSSSGWEPTAPSNQCERIVFRATINSPQPGAVPSLTTGSVLQVKLQMTPTIGSVSV